MARINLLPWRAELRKQREREFYGLLAVTAVVSAVLVYAVIWQVDEMIAHQNDRNTYLQQQIDILDRDIREIEALETEKARLIQRLQVIDELQATRSQPVHIVDQLVRTLPEGVYLTSIRQQGNELTLEGRAQAYSRVSRYMENLDGSNWMTESDLRISEARAGGDRSTRIAFTLRVQVKNPNLKQDDDIGGAGS